jgi:hypothetical protein
MKDAIVATVLISVRETFKLLIIMVNSGGAMTNSEWLKE